MFLSTPAVLSFVLLLASQSSAQGHIAPPGRHRRPRIFKDLQERGQLDERLLPITATTTVLVPMTATRTIWVDSTQLVLGNGGDDGDSDVSGDASSVWSSQASQSTEGASTSSEAMLPTASASSSVSDLTSSSYNTDTQSSSFATGSYIEDVTATSSLLSDSLPTSSSISSDYPSFSASQSEAPSSIIGVVTSSATVTDSSFSTSAGEPTSTGSPSSQSTDTDSAPSPPTSASASTGSGSSLPTSLPQTESATRSEDLGSESTSIASSAIMSDNVSGSESQSASVSSTESFSISETGSASLSGSESVSLSDSFSISATSTDSAAIEAASSSYSGFEPSATASETASASANETGSRTKSHGNWWETSTSSSDWASATEASSSLSTSETASESASLTASSTASVSDSLTWSENATISSAATATISESSTSTSATSTSSSSSATSTLASTLMLGYYPDWSAYYLSPESVDWDRFDILDFAFAIPNSDGSLYFTDDSSTDSLQRLVSSGHAAGKRVKLSIGGWTGSAYFSTIVANDALRATFVSNIYDIYNQYNLDGIDIDWEYPGTAGADGNAVSSDDSANFLIFLQDLRAALPSEAIITTATQVWPFADSNGNPMTDVSEFAKVLDWILIMNYDVWGSSSTPGPNAPLSDGCGNSTQPLANAYAAVASWTSAGMPANQITLGVPAYGYIQVSSASSLIQRRSLPLLPHKRSKHAKKASHVTVQNESGGTTDGQVMWYGLLNQGALTLSDGQYVGAGGFTRYWDSCSSTPWLKSSESGQIVTYDDPESMNLKAQFAAQAGLRGCNVFSVDGDWTGSSWPLTDAVRSGLGLPAV
ncbi:chitinase [Cryptococcus neoformans]|nr:chitinase [Cryptococcus neoformans var. grubii 125.91]OXG29360.1 chitinase [Cryptococcus neoformans var. grubii Bt15]OXG47315.1 chitinase [Cryptococcus neoformans var. grubii Th84]OXH05462.1 chitinase [Cryptococcus neoformans var. grubii]OXH27052.1 chitinase [Cryptococcus neoformans var. grubii]